MDMRGSLVLRSVPPAAAPAKRTMENEMSDDPNEIDSDEHYEGILATREVLRATPAGQGKADHADVRLHIAEVGTTPD